MTGSGDLAARAERSIPGGVNASSRNLGFPFAIARAEGGFFWDADGAKYLDFHGACGSTLLGHRHPEVDARVREAMDQVDLAGTGITEWEIKAAEMVCRNVPSAEKVLFCNSGSEATFAAIRLARAATGRPGLIKFQGCYHGHHDAVADTHVCRFNDLSDVERVVREHPKGIAAVILEPVPHDIGCVLPDYVFLFGLRDLCTREGIVLIFDEVISGFRHHIGGYQTICGITPDLTALGKAMANGYPCSAVCGKAALMNRFDTRPGGDVFFAGTFNGHAYAMAACAATIGLLEGGEVHRRLFRLGHMMRQGLEEIFRGAGIPAVVTGLGSVFVVYFMEGEIRCYDDLLRNDAGLFVGIRRDARPEGVFMLPVNLKRCSIAAAHTAEDIAFALEAVTRAVKRRMARRS